MTRSGKGGEGENGGSGDGGVRKVEIQRDGCSLKQNRLDMLNNLGARSRHLAHPDAWARQIDHWVERSRRHIEEDMCRLRNTMFPLLPWSGFAGASAMDIDQVGRDMREMQREMDSAMSSAFASWPCGGQAGTALHHWLSNHDGLTGCRAMDVLKDNYRIGDDGQMYLSMNFNTKDFSPEDIHVTTHDNRLEVQGKKTVETENSKSTRQFYRHIDLPKSVDQNAIQCRLSEDGVLSVDVPVKTPDYNSLKFDEGRRLAIKPAGGVGGGEGAGAGAGVGGGGAGEELSVTGDEGVTVVTDAKGRKKVHLEMPLQPGFTSDDVSVRVEQKQLIVSGKLACRQSGAKKEFVHSYEVPQTLDPMAIKAGVRGNVLVVEAPLVSASTPSSS